LAGALRQEAGRRRITVQLIDAIADHQIWAERYDRDFVERLAVQDEICEHIVAAIEPQLYIAEQVRVQRKSPANLNGWECIVRALSLMNSRDRRNVALAQALLRKAVSIDPNSAQGHSLLSIATTLRVHMSWADRQTVIPIALASAHKALSLNPDEPWAHAALGYGLIWKRPEDAIVPCQSAVKLDPNFAAGHYFLALGSAYAGDHDRIFPHAAMAERLACRDLLARAYAGAHDNVRATGSFAIEHYRDGAEFARSAAVYIPNSPTAYRALLMNLALGGEADEAKHALSAGSWNVAELDQTKRRVGLRRRDETLCRSVSHCGPQIKREQVGNANLPGARRAYTSLTQRSPPTPAPGAPPARATP
jgi:tetratricopeptide (TPR) repeat protein